MPEEGFLRRWARVKAGGDAAQAEAEADAQADARARTTDTPAAPAPWPWGRAGDTLPVASPPAELADPSEPSGRADAFGGSPSAPGQASPTLDDVARLTPDSDYSIFVGKGVDKSVQRLALKKLFADPHFNVMDRLDMYMDDYNIPSPVSAEMLASLDHARSALRRVVEEPAAELPAGADAAAAGSAQPPTLAAQGPASDASAAEAHEAYEAHEAHEAQAAHEAQEAQPAQEATEHKEAAPGVAAQGNCRSGDLPDDSPYGAPAQEHGPFHRPHQHLPESQA